MAVNCDLARLVKNVSNLRTTREDVIAYYRARYPGVKTQKGGKQIEDWKRRLSEALQPYTKNKKGEPQKLEYIQRRFQTGREGAKRVSKQQQEEYQALGKKLPYIPPANGVKIMGTLCMSYLDDPCEDRNFDIDMVGEDFDFFLQSFELQSIVNVYMYMPASYGLTDSFDEEISMRACECPMSQDGECEWDITVTAIGDDYESGSEKPVPSKGYTTKPKRPEVFKEQPVEKTTVKPLKTQAEIIAEMDAFQKARGKD